MTSFAPTDLIEHKIYISEHDDWEFISIFGIDNRIGISDSTCTFQITNIMLSTGKLFSIILLALMGSEVLQQSSAFSPSISCRGPKHGCIHSQPGQETSFGGSLPAKSKVTITSTVLFSEPPQKDVNKIIGIQRGLYLLGIVFFINVWIFSIPPEFRRAKICTEEQVIMFPNSGCMTGSQWVGGIREYYTNGGGINFDFSIGKGQQPGWMGGDQPFQK